MLLNITPVQKVSLIESFLNDTWDIGGTPCLYCKVDGGHQLTAMTAKGLFDLSPFINEGMILLNLSTQAIGSFSLLGEGDAAYITVNQRFNGKAVTIDIPISNIIHAVDRGDKGTQLSGMQFDTDAVFVSKIDEKYPETTKILTEVTKDPVNSIGKVLVINFKELTQFLPVFDKVMKTIQRDYNILFEEDGQQFMHRVDHGTRVTTNDEHLSFLLTGKDPADPDVDLLSEDYIKLFSMDLEADTLEGIGEEQEAMRIVNIFTDITDNGTTDVFIDHRTQVLVIRDAEIIRTIVAMTPDMIDNSHRDKPKESVVEQAQVIDLVNTSVTSVIRPEAAKVIDLAQFRKK